MTKRVGMSVTLQQSSKARHYRKPVKRVKKQKGSEMCFA